ncbi:MAG: S-layer homology domain-containing protein [Syntrophomonas sp.]
MRWEFKGYGKIKVIGLLLIILWFGLPGLINPGTVEAKTESSAPATQLELTLNDGGVVIELGAYSIDELQNMPQVKREYSSIDSMPAAVFTAGQGLDLEALLNSQNIDLNSISSLRFYATDNVVKKVDKNMLLDKTRYYFPKIVECWDAYWDESSCKYTDDQLVRQGAVPVKPMLAITSSQERFLPAPDWNSLEGSTCLRLCLGQESPEECTTMNFIRWVYKIEVFGKLQAGSSAVSPQVTLNAPLAGASYQGGDNVPIAGTAQKLTSLTLTITDPEGHAVYTVFDLETKDGQFTEEFVLGADALPGSYTIEVGPAPGSSLGCKQAFQVKAAASSSKTVAKTSEEIPDNGVAKSKPEETGTQPVVTAPTGSLNDIAGHWALESINKLIARGAVKGYPDGSFKPDATITRAEFTTAVVKAFNLTNANGKYFTDTTGHWAKDYIATAAAEGIVGGYDESSFGPDDSISREQMAVIVIKAARLTPAAENNFIDSGSIADWAREAVATAVKNQLLKGYPDNTFRPASEATRAEAVSVIASALKL